MTRALCFDLMDTLLYDPYREALRAATGLEVTALRGEVDSTLWPEFEIGAIDEAEFVRRFFLDRNTTRVFDLDAFHRARREGYRFLPGMRELLLELRATEPNTKLFIASNYPIWVEEVRALFSLDTLFDGVFASHHLAVRKPEKTFYERVCARSGFAPESCLFIDDRASNCRAAADFGMRAHVFEGAEPLRAWLVAEGALLK